MLTGGFLSIQSVNVTAAARHTLGNVAAKPLLDADPGLSLALGVALCTSRFPVAWERVW